MKKAIYVDAKSSESIAIKGFVEYFTSDLYSVNFSLPFFQRNLLFFFYRDLDFKK